MSEQWTTECLPHGSGQCDGYHYGGVFDGQPCGCPCHERDDLPRTVEGVKRWHDYMHNVVPHPNAWSAEHPDTCPTCRVCPECFVPRRPDQYHEDADPLMGVVVADVCTVCERVTR